MAKIVSQYKGVGMRSKVWHRYRLESSYEFDLEKLAEGIREVLGGYVAVEEEGVVESIGKRYFLVECTRCVEPDEIAGIVESLEDKIREVEEFTAPLRMLKRKEG